MIKLSDFGLSRLTKFSNSDKDIFERLPYIDPQHFKGRINDDKNFHDKTNKKSNVYSIGVILWEISSGKIPFESPQKSILMSEILNGRRETPTSDTPSDYVNIYKSTILLLHYFNIYFIKK